jgi:glycosyltransferase involved in cell wall biosynthesis
MANERSRRGVSTHEMTPPAVRSIPAPSDASPRLLFVVNACWFFVSHRLPLALEAIRRGYEVHVAAASDDTVEVLHRHGIHFHRIDFKRRGLGPVGEVRTLLQLTRLYRRLRPALVHHVTIKPVIYGGILARLNRVPAVVHAIPGLGYSFLARGKAGGVLRKFVIRAYRSVFRHPNHAVIFQNPDDYHEFVSRDVVRPQNAVLIPGSGVDLEVFKPVPRVGTPLVVLPARLLVDKGVCDFVDAAKILRARGVDCRLALVGSIDPGNPSGVSTRQVKEWAEEGAVEVWGHRSDMPAVFAQAHAVCLPSYREGFPRALIEAAACGLPILTTDVPGCRDVVTHGYNGLIVEARSPGRLADAIECLILDQPLRERMGERSRERAVAEFGIDRVVDSTFAVYDSLATLRVTASPIRELSSAVRST